MIDTSAETVGRYVTEARAIGRAHYAEMFLALLTERDAAVNLAKQHMDEKHRTQRQAAEDWKVLQQRIKTAEAKRDTVTADWKAEIEMHREEHRRRMHAEAERDRLREALRLADAALSGANMNMGAVEKKVRAALREREA